MNDADVHGLESFAAGRLANGRETAVVWISEAKGAGFDTDQLFTLIAEYENLPLRVRKYVFTATPSAVLICRTASRTPADAG